MWCNSASRTLQDETTLTRHICAARRYSFLTALRSTARAAGPATSGRGLGGERHVSRRFMSFRIFVKNMSLKVNWQLFFDHENQWGFVRGIWEVQIVGIERIWSISFERQIQKVSRGTYSGSASRIGECLAEKLFLVCGTRLIFLLPQVPKSSELNLGVASGKAHPEVALTVLEEVFRDPQRIRSLCLSFVGRKCFAPAWRLRLFMLFADVCRRSILFLLTWCLTST